MFALEKDITVTEGTFPKTNCDSHSPSLQGDEVTKAQLRLFYFLDYTMLEGILKLSFRIIHYEPNMLFLQIYKSIYVTIFAVKGYCK